MVMAGLIIMMALALMSHPKTVQWNHTGKGVDYWRICAPTCKAVTPDVISGGVTKTYQVRLPFNAKPPFAVEACNSAGCTRTETR